MSDSNGPYKVLFVCVGNSCRSQMAEALANHLGSGKVQTWSAGSHPLGWILSQTQAVLEEKGVSLEGQWSKGIDAVPVEQMDVVVTMGHEVVCAAPRGFRGRLLEWDIPDPYGGNLNTFREVRDMIQPRIVALVDELQSRKPADA